MISEEQSRRAFEFWTTGGNLSCPSIERTSKGFYKFMTTYHNWNAWEAAINYANNQSQSKMDINDHA